MAKKKLKTYSVVEFEEMAEEVCPRCHGIHDVKAYRPPCHPSATVALMYTRGSGVLTVFCGQCEKPILQIALALISV